MKLGMRHDPHPKVVQHHVCAVKCNGIDEEPLHGRFERLEFVALCRGFAHIELDGGLRGDDEANGEAADCTQRKGSC